MRKLPEAKPENPYVIGEMACGHDGSIANALKIIEGVADAGGQAIQFQIWDWSTRVVDHHPAVETMKAVQFSPEQWHELASVVRNDFGALEIIGCVGENYAITLAIDLNVDAFKLHSSDLSNEHIVKGVAETGKRIDLSVGGSSPAEIEKALTWIAKTSSSDVWLMWGLQLFPTDVSSARIGFMRTLEAMFGVPVGYQDHCDGGSQAGFWLPAAALGQGCRIIEKHLTHDRSANGVDHEAALNPVEFGTFMNMVRDVTSGIGNPCVQPFSDGELRYRDYAKKSIVASRALNKDHCIELEDLNFLLSPARGLAPDQAYRLIGRTLNSNVGKHDLVTEENLKQGHQ